MCGTMEKTIKDPEEQEKRALLAMCWLGVGEILGTLMNGQLEDRFGPRKMVLVNLLEMLLAFASLILFTLVGEWNMWFACTFCFFWGVQDAAVNTFMYCICAFQFDSIVYPFNLFYCVQSFFAFIFISLASLTTSIFDDMVFFGVTCVFGTFAWLFFYFTFDLRAKKTGEIK